VQLAPEHNGALAIGRHFEVNEDLLTLLGFFVAEGSCSPRNGVRLSIGAGNARFAS
jgi:DNA gyrase subunit B